MNRPDEARGVEQAPPRRLRPSGGYRQLRSFQMATVIYDATVLFGDRFIDKRSRTPSKSPLWNNSSFGRGVTANNWRQPGTRNGGKGSDPLKLVNQHQIARLAGNLWRSGPLGKVRERARNFGVARRIRSARGHCHWMPRNRTGRTDRSDHRIDNFERLEANCRDNQAALAEFAPDPSSHPAALTHAQKSFDSTSISSTPLARRQMKPSPRSRAAGPANPPTPPSDKSAAQCCRH
jgi:hypothetical protein